MTINSTTAWMSDLAPGRIFKNREEAQEFERVTVPRILVSEILSHEGRVDHDDDAIIDKIVARLGELWNVRGYEKDEVACR